MTDGKGERIELIMLSEIKRIIETVLLQLSEVSVCYGS